MFKKLIFLKTAAIILFASFAVITSFNTKTSAAVTPAVYLCTGTGYTGECMKYIDPLKDRQRFEVGNLGSLNDKINSVKIIGYDLEVYLYEDKNFGGDSLVRTSSVYSLGSIKKDRYCKEQCSYGKNGHCWSTGECYDRYWGNKVSSIKIMKNHGDGVYLFDGNNYSGDYIVFTEAQDVSYIGDAFNDKASSIRIKGEFSVKVYKHSRFKGRKKTITGDIKKLIRHAFNNKISSLQIYDYKLDEGCN